MSEKEKNITAQIEIVNYMLNIICKELNELETIDDYEIELNETEYQCCIDKRTQRNYGIIVTCKKNFKKEEEKKIPEKLNYQYRNSYGRLSQHKQSEIDIIDTLNQLIDYLKSKGE